MCRDIMGIKLAEHMEDTISKMATMSSKTSFSRKSS